MVSAAVFSTVVALFLSILCYSHCFVGSCVWPCFVVQYLVSSLVLQSPRWGRERERQRETERERDGYFTLLLLMSCEC